MIRNYCRDFSFKFSPQAAAHFKHYFTNKQKSFLTDMRNFLVLHTLTHLPTLTCCINAFLLFRESTCNKLYACLRKNKNADEGENILRLATRMYRTLK